MSIHHRVTYPLLGCSEGGDLVNPRGKGGELVLSSGVVAEVSWTRSDDLKSKP